MMIWKQIRGHADAVERFRRSVARGRMSHSYLFVGPEGIGKKLFAQTLAQCLLCARTDDRDAEACGECPACKQVQAGTHPDLLIVGCPPDRKELPIELIAGSKERRGREGLCYELALRPLSGSRRIAVVDDANRMNDESANALLKTLEEPSDTSVLILIADNIDGILPTIRSRCQILRFAPLSAENVAELLLEQGLVEDRRRAESVAAISDGSLATAGQLLDAGIGELKTKLYQRLASEEFHSVRVAREMIEAIENLGGNTAVQKQNAGWLIRFMLEFYRQCLLALSGAGRVEPEPDVQRFAGRFDPAVPEDVERVMQLFDRTAAAENHLQENMAVGLCLEGLFDDIGRMIQPAARR